MTTSMKAPSITSAADQRALEALTLALVGVRETLAALANVSAASSEASVRGLAPLFTAKLDALDYSTSLLAGRIGWSLVNDGRTGQGADVPSGVADAVARWAVRGKKDALS